MQLLVEAHQRLGSCIARGSRTADSAGAPAQLLLVFLVTAGLFATVSAAAVGQAPGEPAAMPPPNIVLFLADDLGIGDVGSYNPDSRIPTPKLDRLAEQGVRFVDAHAPGSWCVPSRYGLVTGVYPSRLESLNVNRRSLIEPEQMTIASLLREAGYATAMVGKWHLGFDGGMDCARALRGGPIDHGFDYFFGMHASLDIPPYFYIRGDRCVAAPTGQIEASTSEGDVWNEIQGAFWRAGAIAPGFRHEDASPRFLEEAIAFLENHHREQPRQPFFLYLALPSPHTPWLPLPRYRGVSQAGSYGDFTVQVDDQFGEVAAALDRLGYAENTLVIFTSDNGPVWYPKDVQRFGHDASHVYRGMKFDLWEGGHRMPFIARWPGRISAGSRSAAPIDFTDLLPTFAALIGRELPDDMVRDGGNALPALLGSVPAHPSARTMIHFRAADRLAIRHGPWKLIPGEGTGELYHLGDNVAETRNRYHERPDVVGRLSAMLEPYRQAPRGETAAPGAP